MRRWGSVRLREKENRKIEKRWCVCVLEKFQTATLTMLHIVINMKIFTQCGGIGRWDPSKTWIKGLGKLIFRVFFASTKSKFLCLKSDLQFWIVSPKPLYDAFPWYFKRLITRRTPISIRVRPLDLRPANFLIIRAPETSILDIVA